MGARSTITSVLDPAESPELHSPYAAAGGRINLETQPNQKNQFKTYRRRRFSTLSFLETFPSDPLSRYSRGSKRSMYTLTPGHLSAFILANMLGISLVTSHPCSCNLETALSSASG